MLNRFLHLLTTCLFVKLFSDPTLDELYRYFQAGSVAAYEHIAMIKLHYSLVDVLDDCIAKLDAGKKRRGVTQHSRSKISVPAESKHFAREILSPTSRETEGSFSSSTATGGLEEDEDQYERSWVGLK